MIFTPEVEGPTTFEAPPPSLLSECQMLFSKIYPQDIIKRLHESDYDPVIIGYIHSHSLFPGITGTFERLATASSRQLTVTMEVAPRQPEWFRDFLRDEKEYREHGTIHGKESPEDQVKNLEAYRPKLQRVQSERLCLWLLENRFNVESIEHQDVEVWISADEARWRIDEDNLWANDPCLGRWTTIRSGYTAIRRDIHGLHAIDNLRPDIISVGLYHALKYEILLGRNGRNSFYFMSGGFDWQALMSMWMEVHRLYLRESPG